MYTNENYNDYYEEYDESKNYYNQSSYVKGKDKPGNSATKVRVSRVTRNNQMEQEDYEENMNQNDQYYNNNTQFYNGYLQVNQNLNRSGWKKNNY